MSYANNALLKHLKLNIINWLKLHDVYYTSDYDRLQLYEQDILKDLSSDDVVIYKSMVDLIVLIQLTEIK